MPVEKSSDAASNAPLLFVFLRVFRGKSHLKPLDRYKNLPEELLFTANRPVGTIPAEFNPSAPIPHGNIRGRLVSPWAGPQKRLVKDDQIPSKEC